MCNTFRVNIAYRQPLLLMGVTHPPLNPLKSWFSATMPQGNQTYIIKFKNDTMLMGLKNN